MSISSDEYRPMRNLDLHIDKVESINCVYHPVEKLHSAKCPHCEESYYMENYSMTTAMYFPPIYKDGVNINPDRNTTTTHCTCMNCGKEFSFRR